MQKRHQTAQVSHEHDSQARGQIRPKTEESSNARTHDSHPLENISCRIGDSACAAKHATVIQRTGLFHPMNERQKVQSLLRLQKQYGNRFVQRVIAQHLIQTKMQVSQPGDVYEQEADQVAEKVMQGNPMQHLDKLGAKVQRVALPQEEPPTGTSEGPPEEKYEEEDSVEIGQMDMELERLDIDGNSFLTTDPIIFQARVTGVPNADALSNRIQWFVHGISANSGDGDPHSASNQAYFSFKPNPTNRPRTGARVPNDPIQYRVEARVPNGVIKFYDLIQNERDIIRQEYIDLGAVEPPGRWEIGVPGDPRFKGGNYCLIVDKGMNDVFTTTETNFARLTQDVAGVAPPAITIESSYRNPRRNVAAGSEYPVGSPHVWGRALDLSVAGATATLWARLRQAGANAGDTSICERGPTSLPCDDPSVNHVHIEWAE